MLNQDEDHMENEVQDPKAALDAANEVLKQAKEAEKADKDALKEAKKNHKAAVAYNKAVDDGADEKATAVETEAGWAREVERLENSVKDRAQAIAAAKEQVAAAKAAAKTSAEKPKVERVIQNGQVAPRPGTISETLWGIFDQRQNELGRVPAIAEVIEQARAAGVVDGSIKAGYGHWRKFHGVAGRVKSQAQIEAEEQKARDAEAKAAAKAAAAAQPAPAEAPAGEASVAE